MPELKDQESKVEEIIESNQKFSLIGLKGIINEELLRFHKRVKLHERHPRKGMILTEIEFILAKINNL